mgnify:CR=1 FL=1
MKRVLILLLIIPILLFTGCNKNKNIEYDLRTDRNYNKEKYMEDSKIENEVKKNLDSLSNDEVKNINYEELFKDIESLNNNKNVVYATIVNDNNISNKYEGNGYYIKLMPGGEVIEYVFYTKVNDKKIYTYTKHYPMTKAN